MKMVVKLPKRKSKRLKEYDYSTEGVYFVTICSKDRKNIFGEIQCVGEGLASSRYKIKLNQLGKILLREWINLPKRYTNIALDEYIIMPNHIHCILLLQQNDMSRADARPAPTLSDVICAFKSKTRVVYIKQIKNNQCAVSSDIWQRSFYDHVKRNEKSLEEIREYIVNNPINCELDENNIHK